MIIGHKPIILLLEKFLKRGALSQAFLFYGPDGVGKRAVADAFLTGVLCANHKFGGCGSLRAEASERVSTECPSCIEKTRFGQSRDFLGVSPNEKGIIAIDDARQVSVFFSRKPGIAATQAVLIDQADRLTEEAGAALLKTIEEPSGDATLVLITDRPGEIAATICSRLIPVKFDFVSKEEMATVFPEQIIAIANGRPGLANRLARDPDKLKQSEEILLKTKVALGKTSSADKILLAGELVENQAMLGLYLERCLVGLRQSFLSEDSAKRLSAARNARLIIEAALAIQGAGTGARLLLENTLLNLSYSFDFKKHVERV